MKRAWRWRTKVTWLGAACVVLLALGLGACGGSDDETSGGGGGDGGDGPVKFASILSLTGPQSLYGILNKEGFDAAVKKINADGGVDGRKLEVEYFDDRSRPEVAAASAREIAANSDFVAVAGTGSTAATSPAALKVLQAEGVPTVSNIATGSREDFSGSWIFHTAASYDVYAIATMELMTKYLDKTRIGVIHTTDTFGQAQVDEIEENGSEYGVELAGAEGTASDVTDAKPAIRNLVDAGAEAIVAISVTPQANEVYLNSWDDLGQPVPFIGNIGYTAAAQAELSEQATQDITAMPGFILAGDPLPRQEDFIAAMEAAGKKPQFLNGAGWDATMVLANVLAKGSGSREEVLQGLENDVKGVEGADGIYTFSKDQHQGFDQSALIWEKYLGDGEYGYYEPWAKDNVSGASAN